MKQHARLLCLAGFLAVVLAAGCAKDIHQFEPLPPGSVGTADLAAPVEPRSVTELLRDAEKAFQEANAAQERGDHEAALRQYTVMLELLIEADLDPGIFYSLRGEFETVLNTSTRHASVFEHRRRHLFSEEDFGALRGYSEIQIPFPLPERVLAEIDEIQTGYPKNFQAGLDRSQKYLPYIREELRKAGLPEELAWVAMVESLYTPKIVSRAGAGGMWQFMKSTGKRYNLRIDSHVDERFNWQSSTRAAIGYLTDLYQMFDGDWALAVTAYNMGEGGLERAIADNGGDRNLWTLLEAPPAANRIPLEAKKYYARFLATLIVASNPERYGFRTNPQPPENTVRIAVKGMYSLNDLDKAMGLPAGTLEALNPDLIQRVTPPTGEYAVAVPVEHRQTFLAALQKVKTVQYAGGTHTVRRGETIAGIAARYGVNGDELMRLNGIRSARHLQTGARLKLPSGAQAASNVLAQGGAPSELDQPAPPRTYRVKPGDTLYDIARAHRVSVGDIQKWNELGRSARIQVGRTLYVSDPSVKGETVSEAPAPAAEPVQTAAVEVEKHEEEILHTVVAGEYPAAIAAKYGMSLDEFLTLNRLTKTSTIHVGDKLRVRGAAAPVAATAKNEPSGETPAAPPAEPKLVHKVAQGETAGAIAQRYGVSTKDLLAWNKLTARSVLHIGDELVVYPKGAPATAAASSERIVTASATPTSDDGRIVHVVARGHNPTTIARRYGVSVSDLFRWNEWPKNHVLRVGDQVVIFKN